MLEFSHQSSSMWLNRACFCLFEEKKPEYHFQRKKKLADLLSIFDVHLHFASGQDYSNLFPQKHKLCGWFQRAASNGEAANRRNHAEIYISLILAMYVRWILAKTFLSIKQKTFALLYSVFSYFYINWTDGTDILLFLSIEWNSIRLSGPAHGIVTKTVHKTLPEGGGGQEGRGW